MARRILLSGGAGTGKSFFGVVDAGPDDPISYHEVGEPGGFRRAVSRLGLDEKNLPDWCRLHKYRIPAQFLMDMGEIKLTSSGKVMPEVAIELAGWKELVSELHSNYMLDCKEGYRPITDTAASVWLCQQNAFDQQVQEATNGGNAAYLAQLRYRTPNARMRDYLTFAHYEDMDSIFIAHEKQVWNSDPPKYEPAGLFGETEGLMDIHLRFTIRDNKPWAQVMKGGEWGMELGGMFIPEPTLAKVNTILDMATMLAAEGRTVEKDAELLLGLAKMDGLI